MNVSPLAVALSWARRVKSRRSVIFCYHGVGPTSQREDPASLRVDPGVFRSQLELLLEAGFEFVTVGDLAERVSEGEPPPGFVALSFDDGMDDNHAVVRPILRDYGLTATFYIASGLIGQLNPWMPGDSGARMMTVGELRSMVASGFEIGAHTITHPHLTELEYDSCLAEVGGSREALEELLSTTVRTFAYPFCDYDKTAMDAVRTAGFTAAVTCGGGAGSWNRFELPRSIVSSRDGMPSFLLKLGGVHHPVFNSAAGRFVRAATRSARARRRARREKRCEQAQH